jgi:hypothetical protein
MDIEKIKEESKSFEKIIQYKIEEFENKTGARVGIIYVYTDPITNERKVEVRLTIE